MYFKIVLKLNHVLILSSMDLRFISELEPRVSVCPGDPGA